jgi:GNAT superfamily N-acetyltransferase
MRPMRRDVPGTPGAPRRNGNFEVRSATVTDAAAIARVNVQSWREAYGHFLSPQFLAAMSVEQFATRWATLIGEGTVMHVAEVDGDVRGYSLARASEEPEAPRSLLLSGLYQLASMHGSGSGRALLDAAIGDAPAYLWVAELNARARAFYERNGFVLDGERKTAERWEDLVELRMVR